MIIREWSGQGFYWGKKCKSNLNIFLLTSKSLIKEHYILDMFFLTDFEVHLRFLGLSGSLQLYYSYFTVRHCGDAEVSGFLFHRMGLRPLP